MDEGGMEEKGNDRGEGWGIEKKSYLNLFWNPLKPLGQNKVCTYIQRVTEISTLILTGNRTRQKEQFFYLPFCRKTMFNSKKKWRDFSLK
jgi:hypothetical protein